MPQNMTKGRDISQIHRAEALNAFAGQEWTTSRAGIPHLCTYCHPSVELAQALKEHLGSTASLPALIQDLEEAEQGIRKAQVGQWHADMASDHIRRLVCSSGALCPSLTS